MIRGIIFGVIIGIAICVYGFNEYSVGSKSKKKPAALDVGKLEAKQGKLSNYHVKLGDHVKMYPDCIFMQKGSEVEYLYYPVISNAQYKKVLPQLKKGTTGVNMNITVLVKTEKFKKVNQIPKKDVIGKSLQGLVINEIQELSGEEKALLQKTYPKTNFSKVYILEEGRKPTSSGTAMLIMLGGLVVILGAIGLGIKAGKGE